MSVGMDLKEAYSRIFIVSTRYSRSDWEKPQGTSARFICNPVRIHRICRT